MATNSLDPVENNSIHNRLNDTIDRLRNLDRRLYTVTAQVCGVVPESAQNAKPMEDHLLDKLTTASAYIYALEVELSRLESAIGSNAPAPQAQKGLIGQQTCRG
jgi:hypothetical protein